MKKYIPILLATSLLLSACSVDWSGEKDKTITELQKQLEDLKKEKNDNLFKNKQECEKYKMEILKEIGNNNLNEIFYSPVRQSCIYFSEGNSGLNLVDHLTNENLYKVTFNGEIADCPGLDKTNQDSEKYVGDFTKSEVFCFNRIQTKISELKGEGIIDVDKEYENYLKVINKS